MKHPYTLENVWLDEKFKIARIHLRSTYAIFFPMYFTQNKNKKLYIINKEGKGRLN